MDKDELTTGLEADGCLGTSNPDLIIFSIGKQRTSPITSLYWKGWFPRTEENYGLRGKYRQKIGSSFEKREKGTKENI